MTKEKARDIISVLNADEAKAKELLAMQPDEAVVALKELGVECTADELVELADAMKTVGTEEGELDAGELENVAGGGWGSFLVGCGCGAAVVAAACFAPW